MTMLPHNDIDLTPIIATENNSGLKHAFSYIITFTLTFLSFSNLLAHSPGTADVYMYPGL